jgi:hypothetical protein
MAQSDEQILERELYDLPGVSFKKVSTSIEGVLKYNLLIRQPIDHQHPEKGFFYQRVNLLHKGFNRPTVMETEGYALYDGRSEIEMGLNANYLNIEYRFYGKSMPDSIPWEYLTLEQATADLHAINTLFKNIYKGKWVSTGISKGGETTIYYRYFYPQDVDLSVPYVAPLDNALEDKRIYQFLDTIGTPECRNKIYQLQLFLLQHEEEAVEKLKWYAKGSDLHFTYTGSIGKSFEYAVLEYSFAFWQFYDHCDSIPANHSVDDYLTSLLRVSDINSFSDEGIKPFEAHYYQAVTQSGYYSYNIAPFKKYLHYFTENPSSALPPKSIPIKAFDPSLNENVQKWLDQNGNNILYIYGGIDTWSSAGITVSDKVNSKKYVLPGKNHATARIRNMDGEMQHDFVEKVRAMTGLDFNTAALKR